MKVCVNVGSMFYKNLNLILLYYFYPDISREPVESTVEDRWLTWSAPVEWATCHGWCDTTRD